MRYAVYPLYHSVYRKQWRESEGLSLPHIQVRHHHHVHYARLVFQRQEHHPLRCTWSLPDRHCTTNAHSRSVRHICEVGRPRHTPPLHLCTVKLHQVSPAWRAPH